MPLEIERKFLTASDEWKTKPSRAVNLRDGLLATEGGRKVRVRIEDGRATLTIKGARAGYARDEFEYEIPLDHAEQLLAHHCEDRS